MINFHNPISKTNIMNINLELAKRGKSGRNRRWSNNAKLKKT